MMKKIILCHKLAAIISCALLLIFWLATIIAELTCQAAYITTVKTAIFYAIFILITCFIITAITGVKLSQKSTNLIINKKKIRMRFIALNGALILAPSALFLKNAALNAQFGATFWVIQCIELFFGAINIFLVFQNINFGMQHKKQRIHQKAR